MNNNEYDICNSFYFIAYKEYTNISRLIEIGYIIKDGKISEAESLLDEFKRVNSMDKTLNNLEMLNSNKKKLRAMGFDFKELLESLNDINICVCEIYPMSELFSRSKFLKLIPIFTSFISINSKYLNKLNYSIGGI